MKTNGMRKSNMLSLAGIFTVLFIFFAALYLSLFILSHIGAVVLPEELRPFFGIKTETRIFGDEGRLFDAVRSKSEKGITIGTDIDANDIFDLLCVSDMPSDYYLENEIKYFENNKSITNVYRVWVYGERYKIEQQKDQKTVAQYICDGKTVTLTKDDGKKTSFAASSSFTPEYIAQIGTIELLKNFSQNDISNCSIASDENTKATILEVTTNRDENGIYYVYVVSPAHAQILLSETYIDSKLSMRSTISEFKAGKGAEAFKTTDSKAE